MAKVEVKDSANKVTVTLDGDTGDISAGGNGQDGAVIILDKNGKAAMRMGTTQIVLTTPDGKQNFLEPPEPTSASVEMALAVTSTCGQVLTMPAASHRRQNQTSR